MRRSAVRRCAFHNRQCQAHLWNLAGSEGTLGHVRIPQSGPNPSQTLEPSLSLQNSSEDSDCACVHQAFGIRALRVTVEVELTFSRDHCLQKGSFSPGDFGCPGYILVAAPGPSCSVP